MVIKSCGAFIKASGVPRVPIPKLLVVEVVAKLVAEGAEECSVGGNPLAHGRPHPDSDNFGLGMIVSKELGGPTALPTADRPGREDPDWSACNFVEFGLPQSPLQGKQTASSGGRLGEGRGLDSDRFRESP